MKFFMKIFFSMCLLFACRNSITAVATSDKPKSGICLVDSVYQVYQIDSIHSYYLIYAKNNTGIIKIVSKKTFSNVCYNLKLNQNYYFSLHSIWTKPVMIGKINASPPLTPHVTCLGFDDSTSICIDREHGIYDLYDCDNLKGLCYSKD